MRKLLNLNVKDFPVIPNTLRDNPKVDKAKAIVEVDIARLYHHYYIDKFGKRPPSPDPAQFEPIEFMTEDDGLRFKGEGYGDYPAAKQSGSNQLGQAFMRWFLHDHCGVTYFAHMHKFLNRSLHKGFCGLRIDRISTGDVPDYVCAENTNNIFIAEAKGRYSSVSFASREFKNWRRQFDRVAVLDQRGTRVATKGYIVATRFATEIHPKVESSIYAEDPMTPGEREWHLNENPWLGIGVIRYHYARVAEKMNMPLLAAALESERAIPFEIRPSAVVWELQFGPEHMPKRFIGGYWFNGTGTPPWRVEGEKIVHTPHNPFMLNAEGSTFFGVEESIFKNIVSLARNEDVSVFDFRQFPDPGPFYSAISTLRDGTIVAPIEFFVPVDSIQY